MMEIEQQSDGEGKVGKFYLVEPVQSRHAGYKVPYPRSGHCCVTDDRNLYVFGGYHPEYQRPLEHPNPEIEGNMIIFNEVFQELWCFNFDTRTWCEVETTGEPPRQTASMSMTLAGNVLLFFGGTCFPWGSISNNKIYMLDLREKRWSVLQVTGEKPPKKYGQAIILLQDKLFVYGGCRQISEFEFLFDSDLHMLNLQTQIWSSLSDSKSQTREMIEARGMYRHGLAHYNNRIFIIGSSWTELYAHKLQTKLHAFNTDTLEWELVNIAPSRDDDYPERRVYHSSVQCGNDVYICGGHNNVKIYDDVWKLSLSELRWTRLTAVMPQPAFFHSAAVTSTKCMYIYGGVTCLEDRVRTSDVYKIWLEPHIPSLLELSWKTILSHIPDIYGVPREHLLMLGVPRHLIDRLKPVWPV
ncbi:kelch domain-containing protein 10-like [Amphiura filiformis]|uniref:kelch domain-containing protein 10-like n=1 Tax=Amphiura filiformis TaxID=82378 RepID=UPI003B21226D